MAAKKPKKLPDSQIVFFQSQDGKTHVEVTFAKENVWLNQKAMAELFGCSADNVSLHLKNIYQEGEMEEGATSEDFSVVQWEGVRQISREIRFYSLEAIIAVGYRVNSDRGREFRGWATEILKSYIRKGYALDGDRLKHGSRFSTRYFDELYEEIKDIRTSERMMYQKITDIYATAFDYSPHAPETREFFATVQNKLHFAITGKTAAEIVAQRADGRKDKMGLTSWRRSPQGKVFPGDVTIAKNYLNRDELGKLDRIGNMYLDYAELQASRGKAMTMADWEEKLNAFLRFSEYDILSDNGTISHEVAKSLALGEYEKYRVVQDREYVSDFDRAVTKMLESGKAPRKRKAA